MASFAGPKLHGDYPKFCLDVANKKSYSGSGDAWSDLIFENGVDGYNGELKNGTTYTSGIDGYFSLDGTNDYIQITIPEGSFSATEATFILWVRLNGAQPFSAGILFNRGGSPSTSATGMNFYSNSDPSKLAYHWNDQGNTYNFSNGPTVSDQTWTMIAVSVTSDDAKLYACNSNGITVATNTYANSSATFSNIRVGSDAGTAARVIKGDVSNVQFYTKSLTTSDIQQTFDAIKSRYGYSV